MDRPGCILNPDADPSRFDGKAKPRLPAHQFLIQCSKLIRLFLQLPIDNADSLFSRRADGMFSPDGE
jgi:hypothetical protein